MTKPHFYWYVGLNWRLHFMVMMAAASESASEARWGRMCELIRNQFNDKITLICTPISLDEEMLSTREGRTNDKPLMGEVWEVRYER